MSAVGSRILNPGTTSATDDASAFEELAFEELASAVDVARAAAVGLPSPAREVATGLQEAVEAFHRPALVSIVRLLRSDPRGKELLFEMVDDPAVRAVLSLHGIIRPPLRVRAEQALDAVRPYLQSHGGDVELVDVRDGKAVVRLQGSCHGCSMSAATLREGVEEALVRSVAEIDGIEVIDGEPAAAFIPIGSFGRKDGGWTAGPATGEVPVGAMVRFDVGVQSFIVVNVDNRFAVFRNSCAHQGNTLDGGIVDDGVIVCPWHGFRFDATTGECLSAPGAHLEQVPTRVEGGRVSIRTGQP
jgi:nitrite reductase/ring-hydroxylating ferredoxin subunit/Fe-S cluster biogenesis protein NfuA